jgi:glyoxylase-like metal-dependent hydrolase (beta-lactamase superfamily II)
MILSHQGVQGIRVGRFGLSISSACIVYRVGTTAVDVGPPNQWPRVRAFLSDARVERVVVTHHHEDHSGNGSRARRDLNLPVYLPARGIATVRDGFPLRLYQRILWGTPERFTPEPVPEEIPAGRGLRLRAIETPGHSADMSCYLEPERGWLFSGDLYLASKVRFLRADESVSQSIASLERTLALDFQVLFCAHRGVIEDGRRAVEAKLEYLRSLRDEVRALHAQGWTVAAITRRVLGREGTMTWITAGHFSKRNLVRGCLA